MTVDPLEMARECSNSIMHAAAEGIGAQAAGNNWKASEKEAAVTAGLQAMSAWSLLAIAESLAVLAAAPDPAADHHWSISNIALGVYRAECSCGWYLLSTDRGEVDREGMKHVG